MATSTGKSCRNLETECSITRTFSSERCRGRRSPSTKRRSVWSYVLVGVVWEGVVLSGCVEGVCGGGSLKVVNLISFLMNLRA